MDVSVEEPGRQVFLQALNLSTSGVYLAAEEPLAVGKRVQVLLSLPPDGIFYWVQGRVVRQAGPREPSGFAVAFEAPDPRTSYALHRFVTSQVASS